MNTTRMNATWMNAKSSITRVGLVCPYSWDVPGGVRSHVLDLAQTLESRGISVSVLAPSDDPASLPNFVTDGGRPIAVPYNGSVARLSFGIKAARRVRQWVREGDFDVVHIHEPVAPSTSLLACWAAQGPLVATWHSSTDRSRILSAGYYIAQTAMEKIRGRIAVSEMARNTLVEHVGGDAVLIPNGVRVSDYAPPVTRVQSYQPSSLLFLGRVDESRKGLAVLLAAIPAIREKFPQLEFRIAGPGDPGAYESELKNLGAATITFLGGVSDQVKRELLLTSDLYVAPHTGGESFGIVLVEAMAAGTPVAASDLPAFSRVLGRGSSGALFSTGDSADLAKVVIELLSSQQLRTDLVDRASKRVMTFDWDHVVNDVLAVYEAVHTPGEKVTEDLRGQIVGRFAGRGGKQLDDEN